MFKVIQPALQETIPTAVSLCRTKDHTEAGNSGRGGKRQVVRLKNHVHVICHLDDFAIDQTEAFVVIQHSIHVLDPVRVNRSVKDNPLAHLFGVLIRTLAEETSNYTVLELLGDEIVSAVKLFDSHALRIDYKAFGLRLLNRLIIYSKQIQRLFK